MRDSQDFLSGKRKYLYGLILLLSIPVICVAFSTTGNNDFDVARREVLLRMIGDELLLQSGDNTSRVLPVEKIAVNEYLIRFENELTFRPGSLVNITRRLLAKEPLAHDYIVTVLNCENGSVIYGFAISGTKKDDMVECSDRCLDINQPRACYMIDIKFRPVAERTPMNGYFLVLPVLAFACFIFLRFVKPRKALNNSRLTNQFILGSVLFDAHERQLVINKNTIDLTGTETRVLLIFAVSPNETIEKNRLQKEIWEDEGVIVGRSLDMFISKLRKKLEPDPKVKIVNVHGKGYKLEISS